MADNLLLDTQAVVAWADNSIPRRLQDYILASNLFVSAVSEWEMVLNAARYSADTGITVRQFRQTVRLLDASVVQIEAGLAILESLPFIADHKDPFDRLIISQAIAGDYVLIGRDKVFSQYRKEIGSTLKFRWN